MTHICVSKLAIISSDNGLSPGRRQATIWTNAGILLIEPLGTNFSEIWSEIQIFSFRKMHWKMSSAKWRPFCLGLNVLNHVIKRGPSLQCVNIISMSHKICTLFRVPCLVSVISSVMCGCMWYIYPDLQDLYSLGKTSYRKISRSLEIWI